MSLRDGVPLHPAVVHLPLGISLVLPFLALAATVGLWKRWVPVRTWWVIVALQAMMVVGSFACIQTGEKEKDLVGGMVDDDPVDAHEDAAHTFTRATMGAFVVSVGMGFAQATRVAPLGNLLVTLLSLGLMLLGARAGHLGGRLVYVHNAAEAHLPESTGKEAPEKKGDQPSDDDDEGGGE